jgi:DNA helicase II / ATP-dependent DNA helicase PcrA
MRTTSCSRTRLLAELNDEQRAAAEHQTGNALVFAGPGAGKTKTLITRYALLIDAGVPPQRLLAMTFTNKAARELRERLAHLVGPEAGRRVVAGTMHSLCARWLRNADVAAAAGQRPNFTIYDEDAATRVLREVFKQRKLELRDGRLARAQEFIARCKSWFLTPAEAAQNLRSPDPELHLHLELYAAYQHTLRAANGCDFDDLIAHMARALARNSALRSRFHERFAFVSLDELQDVDRPQIELVLALIRPAGNFFGIGDAQQAIYQFRGAVPEAIAALHERLHPPPSLYRLGQNYRSTRQIVAAGQALMEQASATERAYTTPIWTENALGDKIVRRHLADQDHEAEAIAHALTQYQAAGGDLGSCAVLYRTHAQSRVIEQALIQAQLPHRIVGGIGFFGRKEVKDALAWLQFLHNGADPVAFTRLATFPPRQLGPKSIEALLAATTPERSLREVLLSVSDGEQGIPIPKRSIGAVQQLAALITELIAASATDTLAELLTLVFKRTSFKQALLAAADSADEGASRWQNVEELVAAAHSYDHGPAQELLRPFLDAIALFADDDATAETQPAVQLMTFHAAKGLEWDWVWLAGVEKGLVPFYLATNEAEIAEERRLLFVGITRARHLLTISSVSERLRYNSYHYPEHCPFLVALPPELFAPA